LLKENDIKNRDKQNYKEKVGYKLISDNKLLCKEFFFWCDIFNEYKIKLPLFYNYAKSYKPIFEEIKMILESIKNKVQMEHETFMKKIPVFMYKYTSNSGYKEICKKVEKIIFHFLLVEVLNAEMLNSEYIFEKANFCSNLADADINSRNYQVTKTNNFYKKYLI
jgi:hypothetical protein